MNNHSEKKTKEVVFDFTRVSWDVERASRISSTIRSERKDARLSFTSLRHEEKDVKKQSKNTHALTHLPDLINNVHSRLLQEGLGHKAFGDDHLG